MIPIVVDASAALSWLLPTQETGASRIMIAQADHYRFIAPAIFQFEVLNVLVSLNRRGLLSAGAYENAVDDLRGLELELMPPITSDEVHDLAEFGKLVSLSVFDAGYAQLALNEACALASRDGGLLTACQLLGIPHHDLRMATGLQED